MLKLFQTLSSSRFVYKFDNGNARSIAGVPVSVTPPTDGQVITYNSANAQYEPAGNGSGTVTSVSVVSANGLAGTVATATTTPAITLSTSVTGMLKGNGTAISAATAGVDYANVKALNAGVVTLPTITDNGDGTIDVAADGLFNFYTTAAAQSGLVQATVATPLDDQALTDLTTNYLYADYNGGTPIYGVTVNVSDFYTNFDWVPVMAIVRDGTDLHEISFDEYAVAYSTKQLYKDFQLNGAQRQSGLVLSTAATRISTISAGVGWVSLEKFILDANVAGSAGELYEFYPVSGVWTSALVTSYDSTYYSDGTDRQNLGANKYVAKYFFRGIEDDNHAYYIHGNTYNTASDALNELLPAAPTTITSHSVYVGKIVIQQAATNGTAYTREWDEVVATSGVVNHDDLANINAAGTGIANGHITASTQTIAGAKTYSAAQTIGVAGTATGVLNLAGTTSGVVSVKVADAAGTWTMTLPTTDGDANQVLTTNGSGVTSWTTPSGFAWGATASGTSGTGVALTIGNSASAGTIGQSIIVGDTQTNAIDGLNISTGTSIAYIAGIKINSTVADQRAGMLVNCYSSSTQAAATTVSVKIGDDYNTNSAYTNTRLSIVNSNNAGSGSNTGIVVSNASTDFSAGTTLSGAGMTMYQSGAGGTTFSLFTGSNINSSTNGLVNYTLSNTQSGATVMQKINLGTSAQGHYALDIEMVNASTSCRGIYFNGSTTGTGTPIEFTGSAYTNLISAGTGSFIVTGKGGITPRVVTAADDSTAVIDVTITDQYQLTAMANDTTISTTGTGLAGQKLTIRLKDNGTGRALTWDSIFRAIGVTLPTTTVANKTHYIGCIYNATDTKWDAVAVGQES